MIRCDQDVSVLGGGQPSLDSLHVSSDDEVSVHRNRRWRGVSPMTPFHVLVRAKKLSLGPSRSQKRTK